MSPACRALGLLLLLTACEPHGEPGPVPTSEDPRRPRQEVVETLKADLEAQRHVADGGGTATLTVQPETLTAGGLGSFELTFVTGPHGIAVGGAIYLQISPFWAWSTPQSERSGEPGFTRAVTDADGVRLRLETVDRMLLAAHVEGRALRSGEIVRLHYGAGEAQALVDRFAERGERLWLAVDGDGDGVRRLLEHPPTVDIGPGAAARMVAFLPSTARPGESVRLHVSVLDGWGNSRVPFHGTVWVESEGHREAFTLTVEDRGTLILPWKVGEPGVYQPQIRVEQGESTDAPLQTETNPMLVAESAPAVYWGDLQIHSNRSDGTGMPADLYVYGRDVARLDVMSVTDHDHWGMRFLDRDPATWQAIQEVTESFHEPGRFVTIRGFEWTHWIHGHRHVLVFDRDPLPILSSLDERYDHPTELWQALRGRQALTIAHHSAGGPIATDWTIPPDPVLEPVTEVVSVHGSSEAQDSPKLIYRPVPGNFVRDGALGRGYRLGFVGSTDGHDGHPGLAHLAGASGGLVAVWADTLTRADVLAALRARRTYATSGPRILLRVLLGGYRMGQELVVRDRRILPGARDRIPMDESTLWVQVLAPSAIERVDLVQAGRVEPVPCDGRECSFVVEPASLRSGDFLYVRAVQSDGHFAVSSPFYFVEP